MAQAVAYECDVCGKLTKDIFTMVVESDKHRFSFGGQVGQSKLILSVCGSCLSDVGEVVTGALLG